MASGAVSAFWMRFGRMGVLVLFFIIIYSNLFKFYCLLSLAFIRLTDVVFLLVLQ